MRIFKLIFFTLILIFFVNKIFSCPSEYANKLLSSGEITQRELFKLTHISNKLKSNLKTKAIKNE